MFEVLFRDKALKQFKKIDRITQKRVINALKRIRVRPIDYIDKLVGDQGYKLRVGNYRVIMDVDLVRKKLFVLKIGHRRNIYKR